MNALLPVITRETLMAQGDAELLRKYKRFMLAHGLREALWCQTCDNEGRSPGLKAVVTDSKIDLVCRCTTRRYRGQTY